MTDNNIFLTTLTARNGAKQGKVFDSKTGKFGVNRAKSVNDERVHLEDLVDLYELLKETRNDRKIAVTRDALIPNSETPEELKNKRSKQRYDPVPNKLFCLDFDGAWIPELPDDMPEGVGREVFACLELIDIYVPEMKKADFVWVNSSSAGTGLKDGQNKWLWFLNEEALLSKQLHDWHESYFDDDTPVDQSVFDDVHLLYTACPVFDDKRLPDPYKDKSELRSGFVGGSSRSVVLGLDTDTSEAETLLENVSRPDTNPDYIPTKAEVYFCSTFSPQEILSMFHYTKTGENAEEERWLPPNSTSASAGTVVYKASDKIVSSNESSPLCGKTSNAYTAFLLLDAAGEESIFAAANLHHTTIMKKMLARFALLDDSGHVADLEELPHLAVRKPEVFGRVFRNLGESTAIGYSKTLFTNIWLSHPTRRQLSGTEYQPGQSVIVNKYGKEFFNEFYLPVHDELANLENDELTELIAPFIEHIKYLVPEPDQYELFMSWVAETVHNPNERIQFTPLFIAHDTQGVGRTWLYKVMSALVGGWNCSKTDLHTLTKGQFQDFLHKSVFTMIAEAADSHGSANERYTSDAAMRERLIDSPLQVNLKYGGMLPNCDVFTNILILTNNSSAWKLDPNDNRIWVVENPTVKQNESYYKRLFAWLEEPVNIAALWHWLDEWRVTHEFNLGQRAPMTEAKMHMIDAGQNDIEHALRQLFREPLGDLMLYCQIKDYVEMMTGEQVIGTELSILLRITKKTVKLTGNGKLKWKQQTERVWIMGDPRDYAGEIIKPPHIRPMIEKVQEKLEKLIAEVRAEE